MYVPWIASLTEDPNTGIQAPVTLRMIPIHSLSTLQSPTHGRILLQFPALVELLPAHIHTETKRTSTGASSHGIHYTPKQCACAAMVRRYYLTYLKLLNDSIPLRISCRMDEFIASFTETVTLLFGYM